LARSFPDDHPIHAEATEILDLVQSEPYIIYKRSNGQDGAIDFYGLAIYFPESLDPRMVGTNAPVTGSASIPAPAPNRQQGVKLPPYVYPNVKTSIAPDGSLRQMVSYGVIWSDYLKLDFNKATGWANFIAEFLPEGQIPKKPVKKSRYPPKLENAAQ
jgi:hypothetical protein